MGNKYGIFDNTLYIFVVCIIYGKTISYTSISYKKERFIIAGIMFLLCLAWDYYATWRGHWSFNGPGLIGIRIGWLPIEEFLFILIMPFWAITFYKLMDQKLKISCLKHLSKD